VIFGDLNKIAIDRVIFLEEKYQLIRVTPPNEPTHSKGNTLDGMWVSPTIKVTSATMKDGMREVTDHSMLEVSLLLIKEVSLALPHKVKKNIRPKQISETFKK